MIKSINSNLINCVQYQVHLISNINFGPLTLDISSVALLLWKCEKDILIENYTKGFCTHWHQTRGNSTLCTGTCVSVYHIVGNTTTFLPTHSIPPSLCGFTLHSDMFLMAVAGSEYFTNPQPIINIVKGHTPMIPPYRLRSFDWWKSQVGKASHATSSMVTDTKCLRKGTMLALKHCS